MIVPFITIVQEKTPQLQALLSPLGLQCRAYAGEERGSPLTAQASGEVILVDCQQGVFCRDLNATGIPFAWF